MPTKKRKYEARFPPARIKKIMQTDEEIGKVAAAVPVIISRALEIFLQQLVEKSAEHTRAKRAKTMTIGHLKQCIESENQFDFLKDLVSTIADMTNQEEEDNRDSGETKPKKKRKSRATGEKKKEKPAKKRTKSSSSNESDDEESAADKNEETTTIFPRENSETPEDNDVDAAKEEKDPVAETEPSLSTPIPTPQTVLKSDSESNSLQMQPLPPMPPMPMLLKPQDEDDEEDYDEDD